ncbi:MAG: CHAT domain-containing protein [Rivularia sp. (in: cyanobacteria)]
MIQPLEADLLKTPVETLVFVLDGNFRNIPIVVLYDGTAKENEPKYLIEKYAIALTPALQMLEPKLLQKTYIPDTLAEIDVRTSVPV